jgi:CBS domain containing-hemolysin-like protein
MSLFLISVAVVLGVSALCSLAEAALYAVGVSYVRHLADSGSLAGKALHSLKANMEVPIAAILILNTTANTAGAAIAGVQAAQLFGPSAILWFSIGFTLMVLLFSEILPKVAGVAYSRTVARIASIPLNGIVLLLFPLVWAVQHISRLVKPRTRVLSAPEEEVHQMARLSAEEGSILPIEAELVRNVLRLDDVTAHDIMTPRPVVFKLTADLTLREVAAKVKAWTHSRIPICKPDDPEVWVGFALTREILTGLAQDQFDTTLESLSKPLYFVPADTPGHVLLETFLKRRAHLFGVVDRYGGLVGIVSLEDVLESLIGEEIVDEVDVAVDMQEVAKRRRRALFGQKQDPQEDRDPGE